MALTTALATAAAAAPYYRSAHHRPALAIHTPSSRLLGRPMVRTSGAMPVGSAHQIATSGPAIMPISQVQAGMTGYGLTVFHGTKIERFGFRVLGVLPKYYMGQPLILVRLIGGPMTSRGAYLIQGMSGSPCYVNGRLIGAFSMGESGAKEPIGMLTPIQAMLQSLDPRLPNRPLGVSAAEFGVPGSDTATASSSNPGLFDAPSAAEGPLWGGMRFEPLATPLMVSGLTGRAFQMLADGLRPLRLMATPAPGAMSSYRQPIPLEPGAAVGVQLVSGDVDMTAIGTVTYRRGDQLVAFGHPFMQIGPTDFPLTTCYVHEIFPGLVVSHKIASPVKPIGELIQDQPFSVAGRVGVLPPMIPLTCTVDDHSSGRQHVFHARVVNHPLLAPVLIPAAIDQAIYEVHPVPGDATATVTTEIKTDGFGTIRRENEVFDPVAIDVASLDDLSQGLDLLSRNRFQRIPIKGLNVHVTIDAKRHTASIERIFVNRAKFQPGDTVDVGVILRPYRGEPFTSTAQIKIPEHATNGRAVLMVSGGPAHVASQGVVIVGGPAAGPSPSAPSAGGTPNATSVTQLLQQFLEREKNNQLVTRIVFAGPAVNVAGITLSQLPTTLADVMRSAKSSGLRMDRDEVKSIHDTDWLLTGAQSLPITIEQKDQSEKRTVESGTSKPAANATVVEESPPASAGATDASVEEERADGAVAGTSGSVQLSTPRAASGRGAMGHSRRHPAQAPAARSAPAESPAADENAKSDDAAPASSMVSRAAVRWTQSSQADFERGTPEAVGISSAGDIRLAPRLHLLHETTEQFVWSVAAGDGGTYAGTGNSGLVYRVKPDGDTTVFFKTGELEVHALALDKHGNLYTGTSPNGKVFRISPDGEGKLLFSVNPNAQPLQVPRLPARFVLSLAVADDGTVFAGTGPDGRVYRITPDGQSSVFFQSPDRYVMSLLLSGDRLYAGTADSGLVYEIGRDGAARCLYDSDEKAITALALDSKGRLYAGSAPKGIIYRIPPEGPATTVWEKSKGAIYALAAAPSGQIYAACGNVIYRLGADDRVTILSDDNQAQFVALAVGHGGHLLAGSANIGAVYELQDAASGSFESAVHDAGTVSRWGQIRWVAATPPGSHLEFETRSGHSPEPDATWSAWSAVQESASGTHVVSPPARFIQYRVKMSAAGASPVVQQVVISYLPRNRAPSVVLSTATAGEFWRRTHEIKWAGSDPDRDTLTYHVFYSADNGETWTRIGDRVQGPPHSTSPAPRVPAAPPATAPDAQAIARALSTNPALVQFRADLASAPDLSEEDRRQALRQADELIASLGSETTPTTPAVAGSAAPLAGSKAGTTRESSLHWDTTQVPDGSYLIKVVVTDAASNPQDPLSAEVVSDPVVVANQPPQLVCFTHAIRTGADRKALVAGIAEGQVPLQGAEYRIDGGDWTALAPSDGIWDGRFEPWSLTTSTLAPGQHQLELKLADAAGNVTTRTVSITVP
jgi:outer membrane protein assembly factor BamB